MRSFLQDRSSKAKVRLQSDQFYCLTCKAPRTPMGHLVDCIPQSGNTVRLLGLCGVCGGTCNRMVGKTKVEQFALVFNLDIKGGTTA